MSYRDDTYWMRQALGLAQRAFDLGEVPVGALVVSNDQVIGEGWNQPISACDPTAHAEVMALKAAALAVHNYRLPGSTLYSTIEPCTMCFGALTHARVARLVFGAYEPKAGVVVSHAHLVNSDIYNHHFATTAGVLAEDCRALMQRFFRMRRECSKQAVVKEG